MESPLWRTIGGQIGAATGEAFAVGERQSLGGGCINAAWRVGDGARRYFVKLNDASRGEMFAAEAEGLAEIAQSATVRVPQPITWGAAEGHAFLVLEYLELGGGAADEALGRQLAALHRVGAPRFGWHRDNTIGDTPQPNTREADWLTFWREHRLGFQLELAARHGGGTLVRNGEALLGRLEGFFSGYTPVSSLLHGDLWGGNYAVARDGAPVIFDPATYYGDREADIAMTELFGGFGPRFYAAYREAWPLDAGYATRRTLYNLYHVLNHFNMFGGGYGGQAERMVQRLLAELG